jgi:beta-phosphoglucomutase
MSSTLFDVVLFDLDGTLVDTMDQHYLAWNKVLSAMDIKLDRFFFLINEGRNIYELMGNIAGIEDRLHVERLIREKDLLFSDSYQFKLFDGVLDLVKNLYESDIPLGIVTASSSWRLKRTIPVDFLKYFQVLVTSDNLGPGKPDPWPYTCAIKELKGDPSRALVFENAPLGIESAKAAGATCIGIGSTLPLEFLLKADYFYHSMGDAANDNNLWAYNGPNIR